MSEEKQKEEPKKKYRWYTCDVCGHVWRSYSLGKVVKCPKCYENRTGKKLGQNAETMAAMRQSLANKRKQQQKKPEQEAGEGGNPQPPEEPKKEGSLLDRFLNFKL